MGNSAEFKDPIVVLEQSLPEIMKEAYRRTFEDYREHINGRNPEEVYKDDDKCQQVSEAAFQELRSRGIPAEYVYITEKASFQGYEGAHHIYLLVNKRYLLDGTWQSFIDNDRPDKPYLFLDIENLEHGLEAAGVPKDLWPVWTKYSKGLRRMQKAA